jgi:hypothetical protein
MSNSTGYTTSASMLNILIQHKNEEYDLEHFWKLESMGVTTDEHTNINNDFSEETFILAFRRFSSRKSLPRIMISDNASTYVAASKEIQHLTDSPYLQEKLDQYGTVWKFIPRGAPWYGRFWERMIGLTKISLKKVLGSNCIHIETLQTIITEIEATLNDRPITYVSSDLNEPEPLTPSHLLCGRRLTCLPYPQKDIKNIYDTEPYTHINLNRHLQIQHDIIQKFETRRKNEYLTSLREYHRTFGKNTQNIKVGDVVQIHDDSPRITWKLAVVDELIFGKDGLIRAVKLRTSYGLTNRPISKLYPIEEYDNSMSTQHMSSLERKSRIEARDKIWQWTIGV